MSTLTVEKIHDGERAAVPLLRELQALLDRTQRRAFEYFQQRGAAPGSDLDDWLRAEREIVWSPQSELVENDREARLQIAAPGLDPGQIHITVLPTTIVVKGETTAHKHERTEGAVRLCEFSANSLFRRFQLNALIDVDQVSATLDQGILRIVAPKAKSPQGRQVPVTGS
jgi:HSP20 family protein